MDGFLPSQQEYVFYWYFVDALPSILNPDALSKAQVLVTDQCPHMCPALTSALQHYAIYGVAQRRECKWHKVC